MKTSSLRSFNSIHSLIILSTLVIFFLHPQPSFGDNPPVIGYTSQQMNVNQIQQLTVTGGSGGPYNWSIIGGGGSLSGTAGNSVNYFAPASNPSCVNNPTIQVTDANGNSAILNLAVNTSSSSRLAYVICNDDLYPILPNYPNNTSVCLTCYRCDGTPFSLANSSGTGPCTGTSAFCPSTYGYLYNNYGYGSYQGYYCRNSIFAPFPCDFRTPSMKAEGCCPASLISPCQMHTINFQTDQSTINISSGQGTTISGLISGNPGGTTNWTVSAEGTGWMQSGSGESVSANWSGRDQQGKDLPTGTYSIILTIQTSGGPCDGNTIQRNITVNVTANPTRCLMVEGGSAVNAASGNLNHSQALFRLPNSKFKGEFSLTYNSFDGRPTPLGLGWTHAFNILLLSNNNGSYTLIEGNGEKTTLYSNGTGYTPQKSAYPALTKFSDNSFTLEFKEGLTYYFNPNRIITAITDRNTNTLYFSYDGSIRLIGLLDPSGRSISLQYDQNNRISTILDPLGNTHTFSYNGQELTAVSSQIAGLGTRQWAYTYDEKGNMLTRTDPGGFVTSYVYDSEQRLFRSIDPQGRTRTWAYYPAQNLSQLTEKDGGLWTYNYDPIIGAMTAKTDPLGNTTRYYYDDQWNLSAVTDPKGNGTWYSYNGYGNMTSLTDALGNTTSYTYNSLNKITAIVYPGNAAMRMSYDGQGNLTSLTDPLGNQTSYGYDAQGNLVSLTDALNRTTSLTYNPNNTLASLTDPAGAITSFTYDAAGQMVSQRDPLNNTTAFAYNGLSKVTRITAPLGQVTDLAHDPKGNLISKVDGNGNQTQYQYNDQDRVTRITDALNQVTQLTYGTGCPACGAGVDRLTALTDTRGKTTTFEYNQAGLLIKETDPLGNFRTYTYDVAGNRASMTDEENNITQYNYDPLNRLVQVNYPDGTTKALGYDARGNMISAANAHIGYGFSFDLNNRLTGILDSNGRSLSYQYDVLGNRTQMNTPDGRVIQYGYDLGNRLSQIITGQGTYGFSYDLAGRRTGLTYPNGVTTSYNYNSAGYLTGMQARKSQIPLNSFAYTHDSVGNRLSMTDQQGLHTYQYDPIYQLLQAVHPSTPNEQFVYDATGNRLNAVFDEVGVTKANTTYTFNHENKLTRIQYPNMDARYKYDLFGRRIEKNVNGVVTQYVYDGDNMVAEYDGTGTVKSKYLFNLAIDDPLSVEQGGNIYYYHKDGLGSITELTDASGSVVKSYKYNSFGEIYTQSGAINQPFSFTGREYDPESGLYYYRARYYDPAMGIFIGKDPIGFAGGDGNLFRYVLNDPINLFDPLGLYWFKPKGAPDLFGRDKSWLEPGSPVSRFLEKYIPVMYETAYFHDWLVDTLTQRGVPDWLANYPTMGLAFGVAFIANYFGPGLTSNPNTTVCK